MYYERETGGCGLIAFLFSVAASSILVVVGLHMLGNFVPGLHMLGNFVPGLHMLGNFAPGLHLRDDGVVLWLVVALAVMTVLSVRRGRTRVYMRTPGHKGSQSSDASPEETRVMQEIHSSLGRLEERVEALETLLLEGRRAVKKERETVR